MKYINRVVSKCMKHILNKYSKDIIELGIMNLLLKFQVFNFKIKYLTILISLFYQIFNISIY